MEATAAWVRGQRFADVINLQKDVFEGSLVRALRRTEELMGQVRGGGAVVVVWHQSGVLCRLFRLFDHGHCQTGFCLCT